MAYWQNGKRYLHGSTQSLARTVGSVAGWVGIKPEELVLISEYTGGGFGSKIPGTQTMAIPALMSKKLNGRPVMMRISREEETYIGRVRPGYQAWVKMGFKKDGRVTAIDTFIVEASGPYRRQGDHSTSANLASLLYQTPNMRFRGISVCDQHAARCFAARARRDAAVDLVRADRVGSRQEAGHRSDRDPQDQRARGAAAFGLLPPEPPPGVLARR